MAGDGPGARMLVDGEWIARDEIIEVTNPFDGRLVDTVPRETGRLWPPCGGFPVFR